MGILLVPDPKNNPSPEGQQQARIVAGSPLAVVGVFVEILRKRFSPPTTLDWVWNSDLKKTRIAIESAFNEDTEAQNKRPAIFVDREDSTIGKAIVGDFAAQDLYRGTRVFWALQSVPITIEIVTGKKAESAILGDLVQMFLQASSDLIQAKFGFHEMTPVTLGRTNPSERDKPQWETRVTFTTQYKVMWTEEPTEQLITAITTDIEISGSKTGTAYFEKIALGESSS